MMKKRKKKTEDYVIHFVNVIIRWFVLLFLARIFSLISSPLPTSPWPFLCHETSPILVDARNVIQFIFLIFSSEFFRFKTLDFCVQMELHSIKKLKFARTGAMWTVKQQHSTMEAITSTSIELDRISRARKRVSSKTMMSFICNVPRQVWKQIWSFICALMTFSLCLFTYFPGDARRSKQYIVNQNQQNLIQSPTRPTTTIRSHPPSTIITTTTTLRPTYEQTTRRFVASTVLSTPQPFRAPAPQPFAKIVDHKTTTSKTTAQPKAKFNDNYVISTYRPSHNFLNHARASSNNGEWKWQFHFFTSLLNTHLNVIKTIFFITC